MGRTTAWCLLLLAAATLSLASGGTVRRQTATAGSKCPADWEPAPCVCREIPGANSASVYCDNATSGDEVKKSFAKLKEAVAFTTFSVKDSPLISLPAAVFGKASFRMFFVTDTDLAQVDDDAFKGSENTAESFLLHNNSFTDFNFKSLVPLKSLKNFELSGDILRKVPEDAFGAKDNLEVVVFNDNEITSLAPNAFAKLPKLRTVDFGRNNLTELPAFAFRMTATEKPVSLMLSHNQIKKIDKDAFTDAKLRLLELEDNLIENFDEATFKNAITNIAQNRGTFSTLGNPFECTKDKAAWVVELPVEKKSHVIGFTCRNGKHLEEIASVSQLS